MKEILNIETERVDDISLLLAHMQRMDLAKLLDKHIPAYGNRKGLLYVGGSKMAALQTRAKYSIS